MIDFGQSLRKRPYARVEQALRVAQANGDAGRVLACEAELERRKTPARVPTPLTPMAPIPALDPAVEQWLPVPVAEFADRYEVSSFGRVRGPEGIRSAKLHEDARYVFISLCRPRADGGPVTWRLHRLVAGAFVANPDGLPEVNHKDSDRANNHAVNLEWVTREENIAHANRSGRNTAHGNPNKIRKVTAADAAAIRAALAAGETPTALMERYSIARATVDRINRNVSHSHEPSAQDHVKVLQPRAKPQRRFTERDQLIAAEFAAGASYSSLATKYGLRYNNVNAIVLRELRLKAARDGLSSTQEKT